jgi:hypothetical protein
MRAETEWKQQRNALRAAAGRPTHLILSLAKHISPSPDACSQMEQTGDAFRVFC